MHLVFLPILSISLAARALGRSIFYLFLRYIQSMFIILRNARTESEKFWEDRFNEAIEEWESQGLLDEDKVSPDDSEVDQSAMEKSAVYPDETLNATELQAATLIEQHIASLSICKIFERVLDEQRNEITF